MNKLSLRRPKKRALLIIIGAAILVVGIGLGVYTFLKRQSPTDTTTITPGSMPPTVPKPTDRLVVDPHDHDPGAEQHGVDGIRTSDESAGAAAFPTTQPNLVVEIVDAKRSGNLFSVYGSITPRASGSCTIELTRPGTTPLTKSFNLAEDSISSSCKNSIDVSSAPRGEWTLTIKVQVGSNVATASRAVKL